MNADIERENKNKCKGCKFYNSTKDECKIPGSPAVKNPNDFFENCENWRD